MNVTATDGQEEIDERVLEARGEPDEQQEHDAATGTAKNSAASRPARVPLAEPRPDERQECRDRRRSRRAPYEVVVSSVGSSRPAESSRTGLRAHLLSGSSPVLTGRSLA